MNQITSGEYELLLDCIRELHSFRDVSALRSWLLDTALPRLVPSDWLSYNEVDLRNPAGTLAILRPEGSRLFEQLFPRFQELAHQHPLITRQLQSLNFSVHKISDFLSRDDYHQLELYREVYRPLGVEYQIAATVWLNPDRVTAFALSRRQHDYTERDRAVLEMLRPHLVVAFNHLEVASERQIMVESTTLALNEFASATILVNPQGRILCHAGPGLEWLGAAGSGSLPAHVLDWIQQFAPTASRPKLRLNSASGEVYIRAVPTNSRERILLVLTLANACAKGNGAAVLELTPREAEVCHWICEGKANAEIAVILGASPRTVHKHVEHIFAKTGVASRVALTALLNVSG